MPSYEEETSYPSEWSGTNLTPEKTRNTKQNKTEEDRGIVMELLDEENDLDYYSDSDYGYQTYVTNEEETLQKLLFETSVKIFLGAKFLYNLI